MKSHLHISNTATKYFPSKMRVTEEASFFLFLILFINDIFVTIRKDILRYENKYQNRKVCKISFSFLFFSFLLLFFFLVTIKEKKGGENHKFIDVH